MGDLLVVLIFLFFFLGLMTLIGHGIWLALAWLFRLILDKPAQPPQAESLTLDRCANCNALLHPNAIACSSCGWRKTSPATQEQFRELGATTRAVQRLHRQGNLSQAVYLEMLRVLAIERQRLNSQTGYVTP
ncbi:MAG: zinc ribbon domain-containing protein, partial [Acidobacteria bacterium]|nr:zinc ribbon domain-containing protein [Acidobacteriota bacterium]